MLRQKFEFVRAQTEQSGIAYIYGRSAGNHVFVQPYGADVHDNDFHVSTDVISAIQNMDATASDKLIR